MTSIVKVLNCKLIYISPCGHTFCRMCSRELMVSRGNCPRCNNFILEILDIFWVFFFYFLYNFWEIVVFTIFLTFFLIDCYCSWLLLLLFWVCFSPCEVLFWGVNRNADDHVNVSFLPCIEMKFSELVCISLAHNFSSVYDKSYVISVAKWRWWWEWIRHTISFMRVLTNDLFFPSSS